MPEAVVSGGIIILGTRTDLPPGSSSLTPVRPLQVNVAGGTLTTLSSYHITEQATILNDVQLTSNGSATVDVSKYQNVMLDMAFGNASGSINISIQGFVPIVNIPGSTIIDSGWYAGTTLTAQNMQVTSPLGSYSVISWDVVGTINNVTLVADMVT